jgi:hypothetical protein
MPAVICHSCLARPAGTRLQIPAGSRALTARGERLIPAKPARTYELCRECADYIWAQLAA